MINENLLEPLPVFPECEVPEALGCGVWRDVVNPGSELIEHVQRPCDRLTLPMRCSFSSQR